MFHLSADLIWASFLYILYSMYLHIVLLYFINCPITPPPFRENAFDVAARQSEELQLKELYLEEQKVEGGV